MHLLKNKLKATAIALVLVLTISAILVAFPTVGAHDPPLTVPTWAYISCVPDIIGVGQQMVIVFWPNKIMPTASGAYGDRWTWNIEVTKPDGSKETLGPFTSDPVGGGWATYTPDQVGTYSLVAIMDDHVLTGLPLPPGRTIETISGAADVGDTYLGDTSDPVILTVQEEPIEAWRETPLPTEYWERPINSMNRDWYVLAGNWLAGAAQINGPTSKFAYGKAPESAHIMWATPYWAGGIMDERFGATGFQTAHYEGINFDPPIILDGRIYYNVQSLPKYGWYCLDLYTGEVEYFHNTTGPVVNVAGGFDFSGEIAGQKLAWGQVYNYESPNQHGGFPYLWSVEGPEPNTWMMFDAYTGNYICSINNVPPGSAMFGMYMAWGTMVYGKDGSILMYKIAGTPNPMGPFFPDTPPFYLQCWNTSRAIWYEETWSSNEYWMWRPVLNKTFDGNNGYSLNVSIPTLSGSMLAIREGEFIIGGSAGKNNPDGLELGNLWCLSLEPGKEGTLLWNRTFTPPESVVPDIVGSGMFAGGAMSLSAVDPEDGVFLYYEGMRRKWWGYDLETGQQLWESESEGQMNYYGLYCETEIYQGKLLSPGYSGELIAYNITTGEVLWVYTARQEGYESPYGNYPIGISCIADGKIYLTSSEHSPTQPLWRGSRIRCINATDGEEIWTINHWALGPGQNTQGPANGVQIADGRIVSLNAYDMQIYCYGKGPSATTVTAPKTAVSLGSSVMIEGTVTDESPGAKGTPAISDEDMTTWMEYLYMQQAKPEDAQGVTVKLTATDPNGNFQDIGQVTTDIWGNFGKTWVPPVPGEYIVMAEFEGSASYGCSSDSTYFVVDEAPSPAVPIEPEAPEAPAEEPEEPAAPEEPAEEPTEPEAPTEPTVPEEPTEPEPTEPAEAPLITTETAIIAAVAVVAVIGIAAYWILRKRQ
jgi:outer membrane protein assembly factor BamB